ncbi:Yip1 family protein [Shigella flexneri]
MNCQVHELTTRGRYGHVWGLFSHPDREMQVINRENETISHHYTHHVLLMAAIR